MWCCSVNEGRPRVIHDLLDHHRSLVVSVPSNSTSSRGDPDMPITKAINHEFGDPDGPRSNVALLEYFYTMSLLW